jgi:hypothetical protein
MMGGMSDNFAPDLQGCTYVMHIASEKLGEYTAQGWKLLAVLSEDLIYPTSSAQNPEPVYKKRRVCSFLVGLDDASAIAKANAEKHMLEASLQAVSNELDAAKKSLKDLQASSNKSVEEANADRDNATAKLVTETNKLAQVAGTLAVMKRKWEAIRRFYGDESLCEILASEDAAALLAEPEEVTEYPVF